MEFDAPGSVNGLKTRSVRASTRLLRALVLTTYSTLTDLKLKYHRYMILKRWGNEHRDIGARELLFTNMTHPRFHCVFCVNSMIVDPCVQS